MSMEITGADAVAKRLRDMSERAADVRPVWGAVGDDIAGEMADQFATGGASGGRPWAALDPEYAEWKAAHGGGPTLVKSGRLMRSLTSRPMSVEEHGQTSAVFGTDDPVALFHARGTRRGLPKRPTLFKTPRMTENINERLARYIADD